MGFMSSFGQYLRTGVSSRGAPVQMYSKFDVLLPASWAPERELLYVQQAYRRNPIVYRSIEYLATSVSTATMYAWQRGRNQETKLTERHPLSVLLRRPSREYETQTRFLRQVIRRLCISGEAIIYKITDGSGRITEFQLLRSPQITVVPGPYGIKHYEYRPEEIGDPIILQPEDVIFIKYDDPMDPFRGLSPLAAAWREVQTDSSIAGYRKSFFDNAAIPSGVLTTKLDANKDKLKEWASDWTDKYSGYRNAGKTPALAGGLEYQKTGSTPGEIDFGDVVAIPEIRVPMVFGVGPILINAKAGLDRSSYTNYESARVTFWQDTATPIMELLHDDFTVGITSESDPYFIRFDTAGVPALQEDRNKKETRAVSSLRNGAITVNEYREIIGLNPAPDGDVYLQPSNSIRIISGKLNTEADPEEQAQKEDERFEKEQEGKSDDPDGDVTVDDQKPAAVGAGREHLAAEPLDTDQQRVAEALLGAYRNLEGWSGMGDAGGLGPARVAGDLRKAVGRFARKRGLEGDDLLDFIDRETIRLGNEVCAFGAPIDEVWIAEQVLQTESNVGRFVSA